MFDAAEVGRRIDKKDFKAREPELRTRLLDAQRRLRNADFPVIVVVSGVEGAGKSEVVNRLHEWLDTRGLQTIAFWDETDEERQRPRWWRFWRALPPNGNIGVLFGSWYTTPIVRRATGETTEAELDEELAHIAEFERMLTDDGALIVKFWFHLSEEAQAKRFKAMKKGDRRRKLAPKQKEFAKLYKQFIEVSEGALRATDSGVAPWYVIEAADPRYRDFTAGETLLAALERRLALAAAPPSEVAAVLPEPMSIDTPEAQITILDHVDLSPALERTDYKSQLKKYQSRLNTLSWAAWNAKVSTVAVFEGWDAAGKGGAIRRVTGAMDARLYRVIPIAAPTDEERAHHYLWRFWRHIPRAGYLALFDRSWYGRVLVERVEGFAAQAEWMRAFGEINVFEEQLAEAGIAMAKFWIHISKEEQLARFEARVEVPYKEHKITDEDWRNRERWDAYKDAVNDMVARTSTAHAPWTVVAGNDKLYGRIEVLRTFCDTLERALDRV
ncbi:MAG: polyphosphate:AMP phosphotransferase [Gammaproteobacteria bacterium]|nr:polyphosphate:AMP phosphotransferase [Gammaproteobacteria bacterium]